MKAVVLMATPCTKLHVVQEVEVGGTRGSEEMRGAELAGRLPAATLNLCLGCMVICFSHLALAHCV